MLIANMLNLLVNFLVKTGKVTSEISPWEAGMTTRFWKAVIVVVGLLVERLVRVLSPKQSNRRAVTDRHLGLVPRVHRVCHSMHIHIRVDHNW